MWLTSRVFTITVRNYVHEQLYILDRVGGVICVRNMPGISHTCAAATDTPKKISSPELSGIS